MITTVIMTKFATHLMGLPFLGSPLSLPTPQNSINERIWAHIPRMRGEGGLIFCMAIKSYETCTKLEIKEL